MSVPPSPEKRSKSPRVLKNLIWSFSKADTERTVASSASGSPLLKSPRRQTMHGAGGKVEARSPSASRFEPPSSPPNSPYQVSLEKREEDSGQRKLPRSLSSPKPAAKLKPASQPTSPRSRSDTRTTSTTSSTSGTTTTTTIAVTTGTATGAVSPQPGSASRLASPATRLEKESPGSPGRVRTESSPGRVQSPEVIKRMLDAAMIARRSESRRVLAEVKKIEPPPYPIAAGDWIDSKSFHCLPHAAKIMICGFCAVKHLYETGQKKTALKTGDTWTFKRGEEEPMRNWAQRGLTKRNAENDVEYFYGQKAFEAAYLNGSLVEHLAPAIEEVAKLPPGKQRDDKVLLLAKQGDHVLNLALESLRAVTFRDLLEVRPEQLKIVWQAMIADQPSQFELGVLLAYFGEANCIAVQAFLNAFLWQAETARGFVHPQVTRHGMLTTFHFMGPHLLGYSFNDLQLVLAKLMTDEFHRNLKRAGLDEKQLTFVLNNFKQKRIAELNLAKAAQKVEQHEMEERKTSFNLLFEKWLGLLHKLADGDQRFSFACGLTITDAPVATALSLSPAEDKPTPPMLSPTIVGERNGPFGSPSPTSKHQR